MCTRIWYKCNFCRRLFPTDDGDIPAGASGAQTHKVDVCEMMMVTWTFCAGADVMDRTDLLPKGCQDCQVVRAAEAIEQRAAEDREAREKAAQEGS